MIAEVGRVAQPGAEIKAAAYICERVGVARCAELATEGHSFAGPLAGAADGGNVIGHGIHHD